MDFRAEALDARAGGFGCGGQLLNALHALAHHMLPRIDLLVRSLRRLRGLLGVARHIVHGSRHLLHRRGHLFGLFLLAADFAVGLLGHGRQRLGVAGQLLDALLQTADDA